ncbi:23S rRNA (pseudouridine(1915)-N(3))-methyltransferase RlmH [Spiroplasma endosymbiont of Aspidapion aeneum]|uniref:23S rRNA (pseudouridine(1915)-N(3))-methyltransferase RlmH n=1 Tax=Spiroplasma endosymbiont of Aspidapion aeneum TaxID=3066276 RepID=UPI00313C50F0
MIKIYCFNKNNDVHDDAYNFYLKKIEKFVKIDVVFIEESVFDNIQKSKKNNSKIMEDRLDKLKNTKIFLLDIWSDIVDTIQFSKIIVKHVIEISEDICFVIGPSDGFSNDFKKKYLNKISFGRITLTHVICRVILLEQIYRSFKIINNHKYHK